LAFCEAMICSVVSMVNTPNGGLTKYAESAKSLIAYVAVQHGTNYRVNPNARKLFCCTATKKL
jgi:hypothetical protein